MNVTKVMIKPIDMNKVRAFASVTFDDQFVVHDLRVVNGDKGWFVAMPSRKLANGEFQDIAHPANAQTREKIQQAVLAEYEKLASSASEERLWQQAV